MYVKRSCHTNTHVFNLTPRGRILNVCIKNINVIVLM